MKKTVLLLLPLLTFCFGEECDTIKGNDNPEFDARFKLSEENDTKVTQLSGIGAVENGIVYANQYATDDAVVIIDVTGELHKGTDGVKTLATIPRPHGNSEYRMPIKKIGDTLYFVDSCDLHVYDVSTPSSPQKLYTTSFPEEIEEINWYKHDTLLICDTRSAIEPSFHFVSNVAGTAPKIESSLKKLSNGFQSFIINDYLYKNAIDVILGWKFPLTEREEDMGKKIFNTPTALLSIGQYVYMQTLNGLFVYNFSEGINYNAIDTLEDARGTDLYEYKGLLFVGGGEGINLHIFDISNPTSIIKKAVYTQDQEDCFLPMFVDSTSNLLYLTAEGTASWMDVLNIQSYLPVLDTTEKRDTTHAISKDTTVKIDTTLTVDSDSVVTTLKKEITTDSLYIRIDTLVNNIVFRTLYDTAAIVTSVTLDSTVDTLGNSPILTPLQKTSKSLYSTNKVVRISLPSALSGTGTFTVYDLQGKQIHMETLLLQNSGTIQWDLTARAVASGYYIALVTVGDTSVKKKFRLP